MDAELFLIVSTVAMLVIFAVDIKQKRQRN